MSEKQLAALTLAARGHSQAMIARELGISRNAVESRLRQTWAHLGAENTTHAVAIAVSRGIVQP